MRTIDTATLGLIATACSLTDSEVRRPSLLPGWSRGHVMEHVAGNAEGGSRLLEGVVAGIPGWEYRDLETRAADIDAGSARPLGVLVARVEATAQRFADACARVSVDQWLTPVTWTTGHQNAALEVVTLRLFEVEVHHVDLGTGRTLRDWPPDLVDALFDVVVGAFGARGNVPSLVLELVGERDAVVLGDGTPGTVVGGSRADVLMWLLGRSDGRDLDVVGTGLPPRLPDLY